MALRTQESKNCQIQMNSIASLFGVFLSVKKSCCFPAIWCLNVDTPIGSRPWDSALLEPISDLINIYIICIFYLTTSALKNV